MQVVPQGVVHNCRVLQKISRSHNPDIFFISSKWLALDTLSLITEQSTLLFFCDDTSLIQRVVCCGPKRESLIAQWDCNIHTGLIKRLEYYLYNNSFFSFLSFFLSLFFYFMYLFIFILFIILFLFHSIYLFILFIYFILFYLFFFGGGGGQVRFRTELVYTPSSTRLVFEHIGEVKMSFKFEHIFSMCWCIHFDGLPIQPPASYICIRDTRKPPYSPHDYTYMAIACVLWCDCD